MEKIFKMRKLVDNYDFEFDSNLLEYYKEEDIMEFETKIVIEKDKKEAFWFDDINNNECEPIRLEWREEQFRELGLL